MPPSNHSKFAWPPLQLQCCSDWLHTLYCWLAWSQWHLLHLFVLFLKYINTTKSLSRSLNQNQSLWTVASMTGRWPTPRELPLLCRKVQWLISRTSSINYMFFRTRREAYVAVSLFKRPPLPLIYSLVLIFFVLLCISHSMIYTLSGYGVYISPLFFPSPLSVGSF